MSLSLDPHTAPFHNNASGWGDDLIDPKASPQHNSDPTSDQKGSNTPMLDKFGTSLTDAAAHHQLDPVVGREEEILRVIEILGRKRKNNPLIVGEPGVGKTAIVEGLAQRIVQGKVPSSLLKKRIISLDLSSMVAGTMYRGAFEARITSMIQELKQHPEIILYIDEIHNIVGSGNTSGTLDTANILKPALARGDIRCIGATTPSEYSQSIEKDGALDRRFQMIQISTPNEEETLAILRELRPTYEAFHKVTYSDEVLRACVKLTGRYYTQRNFPDKAIDALDEAGAHVALIQDKIDPKIQKLNQQLKQLDQKRVAALNKGDYSRALELRQEVMVTMTAYEQSHTKESSQRKQVAVSVEDVKHVISRATNIPIHTLSVDDMQSLANLPERLSHKVIGQDHVVKEVARAIMRNKVGLRDPARPIGTFLFLGSSGVGKTHLSKQIAREVFGSEDALIRIDMSEFKESHSSSRLVGAPPGYVGYEEGGQLTDKVRRNPYSVVLFDEIEKAHPDMHNLLLQVLDDGILTDGQKRRVSFKNCIIIMTSNVGSRQLKDFGLGIGFRDTAQLDLQASTEAVIQRALKKSFAPEFINRIDKILTFNTLTQSDIAQIVDLELAGVTLRLQELGIMIRYSAEARDFLAHKGNDPQYGARPLKRAIALYVEDLVTQALLDQEVKPGQNILIHLPSPDSPSLAIEHVVAADEVSLQFVPATVN